MDRGNLYWCLVVTSLHRSLTWILGMKVIRMGGSQLRDVSRSSTYPKRMGVMRTMFLMCYFQHSITIISICCAGWCMSKNYKPVEKPYFQKVCTKYVKGHHLQPRCHPIIP